MYNFRYPGISIWLILLGIFLFIGHHTILDEPPQSIHKWRQTDSASFAWNYYAESLNLFTPRFHNLYNEQKAASEFPLLYWIVGMLYRLFQPHHAWFRALQLLIVFSGFWALYKLAVLYLRDHIFSVLYMLLIAASPLLHFYGNGFIPDPPVFALCCWAWYAFFHYREQGHFPILVWAIMGFTLAAMIKASSIGSLGAASILLLSERGSNSIRALLRGRDWWNKVALLLTGISLILLWYTYATWYSTGFERGHFGHIMRSFTGLATSQRLDIWGHLRDFHIPLMYHPLCGTLILILSGSTLLSLKTSDKNWWLATGFLLFAKLIYLYFFYWLMGIHDYYLIAFMPLIALSALHGLRVVQEKWPRLWRSHLFK